MEVLSAQRRWATFEHIGSSAVPGLQAKPVIDMMAAVRRLDDAATPWRTRRARQSSSSRSWIAPAPLQEQPPPAMVGLSVCWITMAWSGRGTFDF
ncbi:GrpB family protein [Sorangium sp. So ce124]|uniref:GrpB family protein n=1 Tax=Sorangium sp. So ce124 TaxID=3133280 RepID=UPI003F5F78FE